MVSMHHQFTHQLLPLLVRLYLWLLGKGTDRAQVSFHSKFVLAALLRWCQDMILAQMPILQVSRLRPLLCSAQFRGVLGRNNPVLLMRVDLVMVFLLCAPLRQETLVIALAYKRLLVLLQ